ncbi:MAG: ABC transporter permease, partial [Vicinamibacterales bacterium]|nr:ABC transporter permease [Vicinamibacterales bacterium]
MLQRFRANTAAVGGATVIALFIAVAIVGPVLAPHDPLAQDLFSNYESSSWAHPLGTDHLGRDNLSRMIYGARVSLTISVTSVVLGLLIGMAIGLVAAYSRGIVDAFLMRVVDMLLAFPDILLAIAIIAVLGEGIINTIIAVVVYSVPQFARIVRGAALAVIETDFVSAGRALGASHPRLVLRHIVPNCLSPIVVHATIMLGTAILIASGLSFLGLGVQPPDPEWGAMLSKGRELLRSTPIAAVAPGVAIT